MKSSTPFPLSAPGTMLQTQRKRCQQLPGRRPEAVCTLRSTGAHVCDPLFVTGTLHAPPHHPEIQLTVSPGGQSISRPVFFVSCVFFISCMCQTDRAPVWPLRGPPASPAGAAPGRPGLPCSRLPGLAQPQQVLRGGLSHAPRLPLPPEPCAWATRGLGTSGRPSSRHTPE